MSESPTLKPTQKQMLLALIAKRGWDEATFAAVARVPLDALTQAQARQWITKLTKETKGKVRPAPDPPAVTPLAKHRKKALPATAEPDPPPSSAPAAPSVPPSAPAGSAPTAHDYDQARDVILRQLDVVEATAAQTVGRLLRQVGIEVGIRAVGLAKHTIQTHSGEHRLTALEQWAVCCRQIQARAKE